MTNKVRLSARIDGDLKDAAERLAEKQGITLTDAIELLLEAWTQGRIGIETARVVGR